ncbi:MAG: hypothetical protein H7096_11285 [Flavobacterium sp.]|nr:hypothetical protein [Pedobacter sp.]
MRELINEDLRLLDNLKSDMTYWSNPLQNVKECYEALDLGDLTTEVFNALKSSGGYDKIREIFIKDLNSQLDKSGIKNTALRDTAMQGASEPLTNLLNAIEGLKNVIVRPYNKMGEPTLSLDQISFIGGKFIIGEEEKEKFAEIHCRTYLSNPKHVSLVNDLNALVALLNKIGTEYQDLVFDPRETSKTPQQAFQRLVDVDRTDWSFFVNQLALKSILK